MAQLKAIVLRAEVDGEGDLLQQLRHLVESLSGEKQVRDLESPRTSLDIPHRVTQPRKTETKHAPKLRAPEQRISLEPKWWPEVPTALAKMYELLDSAEAHPGNLSIVSFRDVLQLRGLAQFHRGQTPKKKGPRNKTREEKKKRRKKKKSGTGKPTTTLKPA